VTTATLFADHALSARIEGADAQLLRQCYEAVNEHLPERVSACLEIAGGLAPFVGLRISLSRSVGIGMCGPVSEDDLDALEAFYRHHGADTDLGLSPYADPSLFASLGRRGFRLVELDTLLAQRLDTAAPLASSTGNVTVRRAAPDEGAAWVDASLSGFSGTDDNVPGEMSATFEAAFHVPTSHYLFALLDGVVAGTAGVNLHAKTANLFGASTLPHARRRGVQSALLDARLQLAREGGCDLAFTRTLPGSPSQRNAERHGFRTVYSRARMIKSLA
jgi:GNAT superfamily N-acetyltransferase